LAVQPEVLVMSHALTGWIDRLLAKPIRYLFETPARLFKGYVEPGMTVLDVGCGAGYYSLGMAKSVGPTGRVIAVDAEAEAVVALRKKAEESKVSERIETRVCGGQDLGVRDLSGRVDFALAVYVVHHAEDPGLLMKDVHRALKPGGRFLIVEPRHHASPAECESTEALARAAGFALGDHPTLKRDWAVTLVKERTNAGGRC
jgi:ubiquinone/menaquinone biosynthesis C-methylase UbiE